MSISAVAHVRRLWVGLGLVSLLVIVGSVSVLLMLSFRWAEDEMVKALDHQSVVIGHSIRRPLERAIGLGIPLTEIPGVGVYLHRSLETTPAVGFIAITDSAGNALYQEGIARPLLEPILSHAELRRGMAEANQRTGHAADRSVQIGDASVSVVPLTVAGSTSGFVVIGLQRSQASDRLFADLQAFAIAAVVVVIVTVELLIFAIGAFCAAPASRLQRLTSEARSGRFDTLSARHGGDEFGRSLLAFNALIRRIHDGFQRFRAHADEVHDAVFDRTIAAQVSAIREEIVREIGTTLNEPPSRHADGHKVDIHLPVFLSYTAAATLAVPLLAGNNVALALAALAGLVLGFAPLPASIGRLLRPRSRVALGTLLLAAGAIMSAAPFGEIAIALALALAGLGIGATTAGAADHAAAAAPEADRRTPLRVIVPRCLSGGIAGALIGGFLLSDWPAATATAAMIFALLGLFCAIRLMARSSAAKAAA